MKTPIYVRDLSAEEKEKLRQGLRSKDGFEVHRSQIVLMQAQHRTVAKFSDECTEELKEILHQSPRKFGQETSLWILALLAKVSYENGFVKSLISIETMRHAGALWD